MARLNAADIAAMAGRLLGRRCEVTLGEHGPRVPLILSASGPLGGTAISEVDVREADLRLAPADFEARFVAPVVSFMRAALLGA